MDMVASNETVVCCNQCGGMKFKVIVDTSAPVMDITDIFNGVGNYYVKPYTVTFECVKCHERNSFQLGEGLQGEH